MRGIPILLAFFFIFALASLLIPSPLFPGNLFCALIGEAASEYAGYLSAVFNGVFYGVILWLVFVMVSKRFEED